MTRGLELLFCVTLVACAARDARAPSRSAPSSVAASKQMEERDGTESVEDAQNRTTSNPRSGPPRPSPRAFTPEETWLDVPEFEPARLLVSSPPSEAVLVMGLHGAGGNAGYFCDFWKEALPEPTILVCPAGKTMGQGRDVPHYFPEHHWLEREVLAVHAALRERLGSLPERAVYLAYSQGATMGALMLPAHGARFPRLMLVEGGFSEWNVPIAKRFRESGGKSVMLVCGTRHCKKHAERSATWISEAGLASRFVDVPGAGHTYGSPVREVVVRLYEELVR